MPVKKPRGRKRPSHRRAYLSLLLLVILAGSSITYIYLNGYFPSGNSATSTNVATTGPGCSISPPATNGDAYVCVNTSLGSFEVELFSSATPKTVANFLNLTKAGFYNQLVWHRIEPGFVIQTGDPSTKNGGGNRSTWGENSSGVYIPFEDDPNLHNYAGYLGMASTGARVGGSSQFYINLVDNSASLDGKYAVFGKVVDGMTVVTRIGSVKVEQVGGQNEPVIPIFINTITILRS